MTLPVFTAKQDENNQWFVYRQPMDQQIGWFSEDGEFFFDTNGEQVMVHLDHLKELFSVLDRKQIEITP